MNPGARTLTALFLTVSAACSTTEPAQQLPPAELLEIPAELPRPNVDTTEQIVERLLDTESQYDALRSRYIILIEWILPSPA